MQPGPTYLSPLLLWLLYAHTSADLPLCKEVSGCIYSDFYTR